MGVGAALHASITGDHGENVPSHVSVPTIVTARITITTEKGRRRQLFSPVPEMKGSAKRPALTATGPVSISTVSVYGGSNANSENSHRKKKSGRGTVWMIVGSGWPLGPIGPSTAATTSRLNIMSPAKTRSFCAAYGMNGSPSACTKSWYCFKEVFGLTIRSGVGPSLLLRR